MSEVTVRYGRGKLVHLRRGKLVRRTNFPYKSQPI